MIRSIPKAIEEYEKLTRNGDQIYVSDIQQIKEIATNSEGKAELFAAIVTAMQAGYAIGYRTAKKKAAAGATADFE